LKCIVSEIHFGGSSKNEESGNTPTTQTSPKEYPQANQTNSFVDGPQSDDLDDLPFK